MPYSLRAYDVPSVAAPMMWDEVEAAVEAKDERSLRFGPDDVHDRIAAHGDLFAPMLELRQRLPAFSGA